MRAVDSLPRIDFELAAQVGRALVRPGPTLSDAEVAEVVAELRTAAASATGLVARASGLGGPADSRVLVVDRRSWIAANVGMAATMIESLRTHPAGNGLGDKISGRLAGGQIGAVFALIAGRILGQFDPFSAPKRLMLVAPNIVSVERAMGSTRPTSGSGCACTRKPIGSSSAPHRGCRRTCWT